MENGRTVLVLKDEMGDMQVIYKKGQHTRQVKFRWATPKTLRHKEYCKRVNKLLLGVSLSEAEVMVLKLSS